MRQQNSEKRRAKQYSGDHFTNHLRLTDSSRQPSDSAADRENNCHLKKKLNRKLTRGHISRIFINGLNQTLVMLSARDELSPSWPMSCQGIVAKTRGRRVAASRTDPRAQQRLRSIEVVWYSNVDEESGANQSINA